MTPGGNPIYKCADCGQERASLTPDIICWCGMTYRNNTKTPYRCLPFSILKEHPELKEAFLSCGCDPAKGEVGIVLKKDLRAIR